VETHGFCPATTQIVEGDQWRMSDYGMSQQFGRYLGFV
jgi:hypothetical protein